MANATIRVQFGNPSDTTTGGSGITGHFSAEIDGRSDGLNAGKTSFAPGDSVYILVYRSGNARVAGTDCSAGSISANGSASVTVSEDIMFEGEQTASLQRPAAGGLTGTVWLGRDLGALSLGSDKTTVTASSKGVAVARVTYAGTADVYKLSTPPTLNGSTDYSILVVITAGQA
jgi:hypothetical protein